jgi:hypothetical protein
MYSFSVVPGRRVPFSCFARLDSFSVVPRSLGLVFMVCATGLIFDGTEGVPSYFHIFCCQTRFRRYRRRRVPFSCFVLPYSFWTLPRASCPVFMFCALGLVSCVTVGVGFRFHVLHAQTHFRRYRGRLVPFSCFSLSDMFSSVPWASSPVFMLCAPGLIFGCIEGVGSRFHVLHFRIFFRRYRGRQVSFSYFALLD